MLNPRLKVLTTCLTALLITSFLLSGPASASSKPGSRRIDEYTEGQQEVSAMAVFSGSLYAGTGMWLDGAEVWRYDGAGWTRVIAEGFGDHANDTISTLCAFGSKLYAGTVNWETGCQVWVFDGTTWIKSATGGFGNAGNDSASSMAVFGGRLYVGTGNDSQGCEVWRTDGTTWEKVSAGGFGDGANGIAPSMAAFGPFLYAGTGNLAGCEVWRSPDGVAWAPAATGGFNDQFNVFAMSITQHGTRLFAGTSNTLTGCEVWSSADGTTWGQVSQDGFGTKYNAQATSLCSTPKGLFAGAYNDITGCVVYNTTDGVTWTLANSPGFDDLRNIDVTALALFSDMLFAGTRGRDNGCEVWATAFAGALPYSDWTKVSVTGFAGATWYLAEGSTLGGFVTWILVENPYDAVAHVELAYHTDNGEVAGPAFALQPKTRASINVGDTVQTFDVSTKVTADAPVVVERAMYLNGAQCASGGIGATAVSPDWYIGEGCTGTGYETWILVENPRDVATDVSLTYYTGEGKVDGPKFSLAPKSRRSVNVGATVKSFNVSTEVQATEPVVAERSLYFGDRQVATSSIGATSGSKTWYVAEGSTSGGFETWVLVENAGDVATTARLTYQTETGEVAGPELRLAPHSRASVNVGATVRTPNVSTILTADDPVIVERSVYFNNMRCGTGSIGSQAAARVWDIAEGCTAPGYETWVLVQNPGSEAAHVTLSYFTDSGAVTGPTFDLAAKSRASVFVGDTVQTFNVSTHVVSDRPVIVERALYLNGRESATGSIGFAADW